MGNATADTGLDGGDAEMFLGKVRKETPEWGMPSFLFAGLHTLTWAITLSRIGDLPGEAEGCLYYIFQVSIEHGLQCYVRQGGSDLASDPGDLCRLLTSLQNTWHRGTIVTSP